MILSDRSILLESIIEIKEYLLRFEEINGKIPNYTYDLGQLGFALFFLYYAKFTSEGKYMDKAYDYIQSSFDMASSNSFSPLYRIDSIDNHLSSLGRFCQFINKSFNIKIASNTYMKKLDDLLLFLMKDKISNNDFDQDSGAFASGFYFLSRYSSDKSVKANLELLVDSVADGAKTEDDNSIFWTTPLLANNVYFGISHGSAMVISFLANMYERGIRKSTTRDLMIKGSRFILRHIREYQRDGLFPNLLLDKISSSTQFSLCYGDLGIGYSLYRVSMVLNDDQIKKSAIFVLDACKNRKREGEGNTIDASITYGAAGVASVFDKLYRLSGDIGYKSSAEYWYDQIVFYSTSDNRYGGYKCKFSSRGDMWNLSFGYGIIGIGIALMRSLKPKLPVIDDLLMIPG